MPYLEGTKTVAQSKTIQSLVVGIFAILSIVAAGMGYKFEVTEEQTAFIIGGIGAAVALASQVGAWRGRVNATERIGNPAEDRL